MFDAGQINNRSHLSLAKNALRKLRTIRHPDVLKFIDVVETDTTIHIVTERVQPLSKALHNGPQSKEDWLIWGLHRVVTALAFVNDSCASTHGNVRLDAVFVASSGEWRLGGFELLSNAKDDAAVLYVRSLQAIRRFDGSGLAYRPWGDLSLMHHCMRPLKWRKVVGRCSKSKITSVFPCTLPPHS